MAKMSQMFDCKYETFQKLGEQLADEENKEAGGPNTMFISHLLCLCVVYFPVVDGQNIANSTFLGPQIQTFTHMF